MTLPTSIRLILLKTFRVDVGKPLGGVCGGTDRERSPGWGWGRAVRFSGLAVSVADITHTFRARRTGGYDSPSPSPVRHPDTPTVPFRIG